jgi:uncharacterized protein YutE (UPF0331/DUF86 family)
MVNREVLTRRLERAEEYLDFLEEIKSEYDLEEFRGDPKIYGSSERFLHLSIEALLDIGNHIIADENLGKVNSYSDIPKILSQNSYIDKELKEVFIKIIGFRNILVHDYLDIDLEIVYNVITNSLIDLKIILKELAKVL